VDAEGSVDAEARQLTGAAADGAAESEGAMRELARDPAERKAGALGMGGEQLIGRQQRLGKLIVRERLDLLFDQGTCTELGMLAQAADTPQTQGRPMTASSSRSSRTRLRALITGFARFAGRPAGIVASQPMVRAGAISVAEADKAARFINICDAFGVPLVFLVDVPGFVVGRDVERRGILRHGAKFLHNISCATVPKVTVVLRKAYGAGYHVMGGRQYGTD
jgi:acetyl-CoA carboxylase carboxyltransferase component